ncbi:5-methyltetrahydropteroyltriglutamate--homocysteine S-methyltransferase [Dietzia lutea]|uniref:Methionine synthase n=1 Tax=Dietzia lutea TaxID=546160 RepID=A0A2S1RB47_9ACTN|nr:5-methyltetrahydropteroyltriglutamate--homocysteine S-methyltransferase [Dietzia lutea]AWH93519.1 methionine synthase [Dietzia lutea]
MSIAPPFRADVVGSFLRPEALQRARAAHEAGELDDAGLREVEDQQIRELVARQQENGLKAVTDGEFRRSWWHFDYFGMLDGVEVVELDHGLQFTGVETKPRGLQVNGRIGFPEHHPMLEHFIFLRDRAQQVGGLLPKMTIPAPTVLHFRLEQDAIATEHYADRDETLDDLAAAYRDAIRTFYEAGCRYLQFDDTAWAYLCSEEEMAKASERGVRTDRLAERYSALLDDALRDKPDDLTVTTHVCRGNFRSTWIASGGYEPVAEQLLGNTAYDGYFLEYDTDRAGGFEPLRFLPEGEKTVVLGLITSKSGDLENPADVRRRIDEASRFAPLEQLALSPQCGFASTEEGNVLTEEQQWSKVRSVVDIAREVWGAETPL